MAYVTASELASSVGTDVLNAVADLDDDGVFDSAVVTDALAKADEIVDSYLSAYLPLSSPIAPSVVDAVVAIAMQKLRGHRDEVTENSRQHYEDAMAWLKAIANGTAVLPGATDSSGDDPGAPEVVAADRVWTRETGRMVF